MVIGALFIRVFRLYDEPSCTLDHLIGNQKLARPATPFTLETRNHVLRLRWNDRNSANADQQSFA
tara:strand:- start:766 stop:960 length:195 start_codon:yes stop_codon:yes gene_type:complete